MTEVNEALKKGLDILSLEAKDIYIAMQCDKKTGYSPRYKTGERVGELYEKKFLNKLDYSLELIKLYELNKNVVRRNDFYYTKGVHNYSLKVINVKFTYSVKEFNKTNSHTYVRLGEFVTDDDFVDNVVIRNNILIAIKTNTLTNVFVNEQILENYFQVNNDHYIERNIPALMSTKNLRSWIYDNGFTCDGNKYVRYKRSSGSSRVGKCLFIDKRLRSSIKKWENCGLKFRNGEVVDLASLEAYISLPLSSIIDTITISPKNILIIDDFDSIFTDHVVSVEMENGKLVAYEKESKITNSIWDGQSLIDKGIMGKYKNKGMILLRIRFFKTCAFNANIQQFFKDNNIIDISQLNGFTLASSIEDIKLITTPNSIKYLKFGKLIDWLNNIDNLFGIVKHEKKTHFFDGKLVRTHYQLMNTLQMSNEEVKRFAQPSLDYLNLIKTDPVVFRYHIKFSLSTPTEGQCLTNTDIVYRMLGQNNEFYKTELFSTFCNETCKSFRKKLSKGKFLVHGNYSTIVGNPIEMLMHSIGKFNGESLLGKGNISSTNFSYRQTLLCCRSPHVACGNILLANNKNDDNIDKYMNLTTEIVAINSIGENILQRLNGCDFDSDSFLMTDNKQLINVAIKNYDKFEVPTCNVSAKKIKRYYNDEHRCDLDIKTSDNKIGENINLAQLVLSIMWDEINKNGFTPFARSCYIDVCKLSVLSGIEIDRAKKEFDVNTSYEINVLKEKYIGSDKIKPYFFKSILQKKGFKTDNVTFEHYETTMNYVQKAIRQKRTPYKSKKEIIPLSAVFNTSGARKTKGSIEIVNQVIEFINELDIEIKSIRSNDHKTLNEKIDLIEMAKKDHANKFMHLNLTESQAISILQTFDNKEYFKKFYLIAFNYLFTNPCSVFYKILTDSKEKMVKLQSDKNGNIEIFNIKFVKTCINQPK